jgi:methylenetetrahydrofolate dehydrogenase (NADP+)/methenyltetrahydrofolate cyclohydrolase
MRLLDGKPIARDIRAKVKEQALAYRANGVIPTLLIIIATEDEQAAWYVRSIRKAAEACDIKVHLTELSADAPTEMIADALRAAAIDPMVHGILLQTPLPAGVKIDELLSIIPPQKDVDGASPISAGRLLYGQAAFAPATAEAVLTLLDYYNVLLPGKQAVVVGRSRIVGRPAAHLLLERDATVTICHSRSSDLPVSTRTADVLVVAAGKPGLITSADVKPGAVVIDVGTNVTDDNRLVGDVAADVAGIADLTPVPGGVGPVTTSLILQHTLTSVSNLLATAQALQH